MYDFSSTEEAITFSLADLSIGPYTKGLIFEEVNGLKSNSFVRLLLCHEEVSTPDDTLTCLLGDWFSIVA